MATKPITWAQKYRPQKYRDVLGQAKISQLLQSRVRNGTAFDVSYIFSGGYGRGKTTLARIHSKAMLCQQIDRNNPEPCDECDNCIAVLTDTSEAFSERDAASNGKVEDMRDIVDGLVYSLVSAPKRIYVFDEAQRMSTAAQDVLLKPLEDGQFTGMFCTTEVDKIRGAIRSRCEEHSILPVTRDIVLAQMEEVLQLEGVGYDREAVEIVVDHAQEHVRDVYNNLQMLSQLGRVSVDSVRYYLKLHHVSKFYEILLSLDNPSVSITLVESLCDELSSKEVAAGIADAAMASFKLGIKTPTSLAHLDRKLAEKVFDRYKAHCVRFVSWFSDPSRGMTQASLVGDIAIFGSTPGNLPDVAQPVIFGSSNTITAPQTSANLVPEAPPKAPIPDAPHLPSNPLDAIASARPLPRSRPKGHTGAEPISFGSRPKAHPTPLSSSDWHKKFDALLEKKKQSQES